MEALTASELLAKGYAIIAPTASQAYQDAWMTNVAPWVKDPPSKYNSSGDGQLLEAIMTGFDSGAFGVGCCNKADMHAIGFSSGAYMTSRMAFLYPGAFRSLSIQSGSYYYCGGSFCPFPARADDPYLRVHPPTLFLHGAADQIVPPATSLEYEHNLVSNWSRHAVRYTEPGKGHQWIDSAPTRIPAWIASHSPQATQGRPANNTHGPPLGRTAPSPREAFQITHAGMCLHPTSGGPFGVLRMVPCTPGQEWVRWESGALAHHGNTALCIRSNAHDKAGGDACKRGNVLWLEGCAASPLLDPL
jgi:hypothetical protein